VIRELDCGREPGTMVARPFLKVTSQAYHLNVRSRVQHFLPPTGMPETAGTLLKIGGRLLTQWPPGARRLGKGKCRNREVDRAISADPASLGRRKEMQYGKSAPAMRTEAQRDGFDLDQLLHPGQAFDHPNDVVNDPDLTLNEKRAILSSWASDACAVDSQPHLRRPPGVGRLVTFDEIVDALKALDAATGSAEPHVIRRQLRKQRLRGFAVPWRRSRSGDEGSQLGA
jgi:hypothetical protein